MTADDKIIRWDDIRRTQMGYVIGVLITLSLGFLTILIKEPENIYFNISSIFIVISIICGIGLSYNRLLDFRMTAKKTKGKDVDKGEIERIENKTWKLLIAQLLFFAFSLIIIVIYSICNVISKF